MVNQTFPTESVQSQRKINRLRTNVLFSYASFTWLFLASFSLSLSLSLSFSLSLSLSLPLSLSLLTFRRAFENSHMMLMYTELSCSRLKSYLLCTIRTRCQLFSIKLLSSVNAINVYRITSSSAKTHSHWYMRDHGS